MNNKLKLIGVTQEGLDALQNFVAIPSSIRPHHPFDNGKRLDKIDAYTMNLFMIDGPLAGHEFSLRVIEKPTIQIGERVKVIIDDYSVYARTTQNSQYASVEVSFIGKILNKRDDQK